MIRVHCVLPANAKQLKYMYYLCYSHTERGTNYGRTRSGTAYGTALDRRWNRGEPWRTGENRLRPSRTVEPSRKF